jgi:hypothetical protein
LWLCYLPFDYFDELLPIFLFTSLSILFE